MKHIPINVAMTPQFDSIATFLKAFQSTPLVADSPDEISKEIYGAVKQAVNAVEREFPNGMPDCDDARRRLEAIFDDLPENIKSLALRAFIPNLSFYTDACLHRKALAAAFSGAVTAMIECFPAEFAKDHLRVVKFVTRMSQLSDGLTKALGFENADDPTCDCEACTLRRKLQKDGKAMFNLKEVDVNDPNLPEAVKKIIEEIKSKGDDAKVQKSTLAINFTKPDEWAEGLAKFPEDARPLILKALRNEYRKATGKYAPGDPAVSNN